MKKTKTYIKGRGCAPLLLALVVASLISSPAVLAVPAAPINIGVFSQRDFVSASGYTDDDQVVVRVIHDPANFALALPANSGGETETISLVGMNGNVEVNHPGGVCWLDKTPDIRPGDTVQVEIVANDTDPTRVGRIDETIVRNITAKRPEAGSTPGTVVVHGTAQTGFTANPSGPLPVGELEQRLIAGGVFANGTPRLTSTSDGALAYDDPNGINWTATYSGLSPADVTLALAAESSGKWLNGTEITTYEIGAGVGPGPQAACSSVAPLEILPPPFGADFTPPSVPQNVTASTNGPNTVIINWDSSQEFNPDPDGLGPELPGVNDNPGVTNYGVYRISGGNSVAIAQVKNPDGTAPAPITFIDNNVPAGTYTYKVDAVDSLGNRSALSVASSPSVTTQMQSALDVEANEPPAGGRALLAFPSRDFVSADGYAADEKVEIEIIRNGFIISSVDNLTPVDGIVEVNHPGGGCWEGVTPELRAGDIVRATATNNGNVRSIDQIHVANVTARMAELVTDPGIFPAIIKVHGTAQSADGSPIPIDEIEQRLISSSADPFSNGKKSLRAPGDGQISYDDENNPAGINWTATYSLVNQEDVDLALSVESRILWLGRVPGAGVELTLFENGLADPPGPATPDCLAPIEQPDDIAPSKPIFTNITADLNLNQFTLTWEKSTDNWEVAGYQIYDGGNLIAVVGSDVTSHVLSFQGASQHTFTLRAFDNASPLGSGDDFMSRLTDGLGNPYGNLSDEASCCSPNTPMPEASIDPAAGLSFGTATLSTQTASQVVTITNSGTADLTLTAITIVGANPDDFTRTGGTCPVSVGIVSAGGNCTVEIAFKPTAIGSRQATLKFSGNAANSTNLTVPLAGVGEQTDVPPAIPVTPVLPVTGDAVPPMLDTPFQTAASNNAILVLNKSLVNFGKVKMKAKKDLKLIVKNISNTAVKPRFSITGKGFKKVSSDCKILAANRTCNIVVRFNAPGKKATANGKLGVMANGMPDLVTAALTAATK